MFVVCARNFQNFLFSQTSFSVYQLIRGRFQETQTVRHEYEQVGVFRARDGEVQIGC